MLVHYSPCPLEQGLPRCSISGGFCRSPMGLGGGTSHFDILFRQIYHVDSYVGSLLSHQAWPHMLDYSLPLACRY